MELLAVYSVLVLAFGGMETAALELHTTSRQTVYMRHFTPYHSSKCTPTAEYITKTFQGTRGIQKYITLF